MKIKRRITVAALSLVLIGAALGCSGAEPPTRAGSTAGHRESGSYTPTFSENSFAEPQTLCEGVQADLSTAPQGYIGLRTTREKKIKAQLALGESTYTYTVPGDGTVTYLPLQGGSGSYRLRVLENTVEEKYLELYAAELPVTLSEEFGPFLHANQMVNFTQSSACVALAEELCGEAADEAALVSRIYEYICGHVRYDNQLAATAAAGYIPDPDRTLESGRGICFDYAALAAAMFRSCGIPAKVITGYVGEDALYHAWNAVYLQESGWITVELKIDANDWTRLDLTFAAAGEDESVYVDRFVY